MKKKSHMLFAIPFIENLKMKGDDLLKWEKEKAKSFFIRNESKKHKENNDEIVKISSKDNDKTKEIFKTFERLILHRLDKIENILENLNKTQK